MITSAKTFLSEDLFSPNNSLNLANSLDSCSPAMRIGAITVVAGRTDSACSLSSLTHACCDLLEPILFMGDRLREYRAWLFAALGPWHPDSAITNYRRLWGFRSEIAQLRDMASVSPEVQFRSVEGIRYAAILGIDREKFCVAAEVCRTDAACMLLLSKRPDILSEACVREMFACAFPKDKKGVESVDIDWANLAFYLSKSDDVALRVSGAFDDRDVAIDLIAQTSLLTARFWPEFDRRDDSYQ